MKKNNFLIYFKLALLLSFSHVNAERVVLSNCNNNKDEFLKNEYILDLEKSSLTRNYIYNQKTYNKYRVTDLSVKKENTQTRFIYQEKGKILTDKIGYPQFYTQLLFEIDNPNIMIKTVINNEEGIYSMSNCKKIERYKKES